MNETPNTQESTTELFRQWIRLAAEISRLSNSILNCIFALTLRGSRRRSLILLVGFVILVLLFGLTRRPISEWTDHISQILFYLKYPPAPGVISVKPYQQLTNFLMDIYLTAPALHFLLLVLLPFMVALQLASIYLADIFELNRISTARAFIIQAALTGGNSSLRIREGEVSTEDQQLPIYQIGGPGSVIIELDSVALFEEPDGFPHVVGPTVRHRFVLDGFERFREGRNLVNHQTEPFTIKSRSLDGIPITAQGVIFRFSVARTRDPNGRVIPPTIERPYTFRDDETVESLIYNLAATVTPEGPRPADRKQSWHDTMTQLIRGALGRFMSEHNLTEYLASFGLPEIQLANEQTNTVINTARRVLSQEAGVPIPPIDQNPPPFHPRPQIRNELFGQFATEFANQAAQRGVDLQWVGIGSWSTPSQIVPEQHLEAWQLSMDNQSLRNNGTADSNGRFVAQFIQDVPLSRYEQGQQAHRPHRETMVSLLIGYREQFMKILHIMEKKREPFNNETVETILRALRHINQILAYPEDFDAHWVGGNGDNPPAPTENGGGFPPTLPRPPQAEAEESIHHDYSPEEQQLFAQLAQMARNIDTAERLLEYERRLAPNESETELIRRAIARLERDNQ